MVNLNPNINATQPGISSNADRAQQSRASGTPGGFSDAAKAAEKYVSKVDDLQQASEVSIKDLLAGKNEDINSMVSAVAKADMSFKLLVGVRNKLIEAYKQTMNMNL
ncbi:MAG: flagellar hook-basal body complex protein FliE [Phycisphaerae bacterium]|nr:flagellar hook-basal body complex protein FliE [Phycisphaerae bacterium]